MEKQTALFNDYETGNVSLTDVAAQLNVSMATVRNWVKTGYLQPVSSKFISKESFDLFVKEQIGKNKLTARANKLHKQSESEIVDFKIITGAETISQYEQSLPESFRNQEGIFYTPYSIVEDMLESMNEVENKTFLEPCCGSGNFVMAAIKKGIHPNNIFAFDTDPNAVNITKKRIFELTGIHSENIVCGDFLEEVSLSNKSFDYIFTNPPWGKKISKTEKNRYARLLQTGNSTDTSSLFFFACLKLLKDHGKLGFLLPEAFFNIATFEDARNKSLQFAIERLTDYGKAFTGLLTKAQAIILTKSQPFDNHTVVCTHPNLKFTRLQTDFAYLPKHIFNFWNSSEEADTIKQIFNIEHITLKHNAQWALGIVTGNNDRLCSKEPLPGYVPIYRGKDITLGGLQEPSLYIDERLEQCQQVAPVELYKANKKLIYRFISNKLIFYYDTQGRYILNSANLLIPNDDFPLSGEHVCDLLNSNIMTWLFQSLFHTHKILRSDLEYLPLHTSYFTENKRFNEDTFLAYLRIEKHIGNYRIRPASTYFSSNLSKL